MCCTLWGDSTIPGRSRLPVTFRTPFCKSLRLSRSKCWPLILCWPGGMGRQSRSRRMPVAPPSGCNWPFGTWRRPLGSRSKTVPTLDSGWCPPSHHWLSDWRFGWEWCIWGLWWGWRSRPTCWGSCWPPAGSRPRTCGRRRLWRTPLTRSLPSPCPWQSWWRRSSDMSETGWSGSFLVDPYSKGVAVLI